MTDLLHQFAIGNFLVSAPVALAAYRVHRSQCLPALAHLLWLLVLVKLVTPPLATIPVVPIPTLTAATTAVITSAELPASPRLSHDLPSVASATDDSVRIAR